MKEGKKLNLTNPGFHFNRKFNKKEARLKSSMKKLISITLIFFFIFSIVKPCIPFAFNYISKKVWEISHNYKVRNISPRTNFLVVLKDMAKNNNPKPTNPPQPDSINQSSFSFLCLISKNSCSFSLDETSKEFFPYCFGNIPLVFRRNTSPPPKVA